MGRRLIISDKVKIKAAELGIKGNIEKTLRTLVKEAEPIEHLYGNFKNKNFIFFVDGQEIKAISSINGSSKSGNCPDCGDDGYFCLTCNT